MAHFRNINDVKILSDINLYSMLEKNWNGIKQVKRQK